MLGVPVLGPLASFSKHRPAADKAILAIGNNAVHERAAMGYVVKVVAGEVLLLGFVKSLI